MSTVHPAKYQILEVMKLPIEVVDELCDECASNDSGKIVNPEYYPELKKWLVANGHSDTDCYIGWWSW
jgi:hypothetical protein